MPATRSTRATTPSPSPSSRLPRPSLPPISTASASLPITAVPVPPTEASPRVVEEPVSARLAAAASLGTIAASSSFAGGGSARDGFEMEPIVTSHRRRKSSLMNPVGHLPPSSGRPRSQSLRGSQSVAGSSTMIEEPKIAEEGGFVLSSAASKRDHDSDSFTDEDLRDDEETGLTTKEKKRKQKKKRRNTLLDQRIAREKNLSPEEQKQADKSVVKSLAINLCLILLWYSFSLSISLYNKWMFDKDRLNFAFPLFTTSMHMVVQFVLSGTVLYFVPRLRPQLSSHESDMGRSRHESESASTKPVVSKMFYLTRIGPCGCATGLDIGLGNTSLKFISLTFYTMCKSSSLAFVLLFAFLFRLETPTWRLIAIVATMTLGVILMVFGEVEFKLGGFILIISAAFFSGFRWSLTQILLLRHPATSNPFSSIFLLTPVMFVTLLGLAIPVEGFGPLSEGLGVLSAEWGAGMTPLFLFFPGCLAFLMTAAEFALLKRTSVVTLSIAGIFKEVVTITAASIVFEDKITVINFIGLLTTIGAIAGYNYIKITKMRQDALTETHGRYELAGSSQPSSGTATDVDDDDDDGQEETAGLLRSNADLGGDGLLASNGDTRHTTRGEANKEAALERQYLK
ncbi:putative transporter-like protein [Hapsidospora chrysogenum ATCC 11550]|uniref:Putative transporter-like protein n=1 Tax=Hapsidospora chrysogenum (strain ATCC 11550 / CBS 779.69 / DSM 880 / IAM 14645 / JCM 23072 / IMI 49137) TaxID=857340 RepID=A0A086T2L0_HAPC1|nr:putative transporter-like protein [Hapsidospora chrysogenum ATCC 11550]